MDETPSSKIVSAIPANFNSDVLLTDDEQGVVYFKDSVGNFNLSKPLLLGEIPAAAAAVDADADLVPELFVAFSNGARGYWGFVSHSETIVTAHNRVWNARNGLCTVISGSSIATSDLDGDCQAKFVIPTSCG